MAKKMTDILKAPVVTPEPEKVKLRNKEGDQLITLSVRVTLQEWQNLMGLMTAERMKIQPYLRELAKADFERRGLEF